MSRAAAIACVALVVAVLVVGGVVALKGRTRLNADGVVTLDGKTPASPEGLAAGAGTDPNRYALARVIQSEVGGLSSAAKAAVAHAVLNEARARGVSVLALVTRQTLNGKPGPGNGYFGRQRGRYCASTQDPTLAVLALADDCASGVIPDDTGGARWFDSPEAYGKQAGTANDGGAAHAQRERAAGKVAVAVPGVPLNTLRLWRLA